VRTITIHPVKISTASYSTMLLDLESRLPAAIAIALQRLGGLGGLTLHPPADTTIAEEFARLQRAISGTATRPGLTTILQRLARDPHHVLRTEERWLPSERSRRPIPSQLTRAFTMPNNLTVQHNLLRVADRRSVTTFDVYENQLLLLFWSLVNRRARLLSHVLAVRNSNAMGEEVRSLRRELELARRQATFLDEVALLRHVPTQLTMVLLKRPEYHAALAGYLEFHRSLAVRFENPELDSPLENLPHLYQIWGAMEVMVSLLEIAASTGYRLESQHLVRRSGSDSFVQIVPDGRPLVMLKHPDHHTAIRLIPEQRFEPSGALRSISYTQIPDIVVDIRDASGSSRLYLFDPKYKLDGELSDNAELPDGKPKKIDIDKMHAYRDAIRDTNGDRIVESAMILYPGPPVSYARGIGALQAIPGRSELLARNLANIFNEALSPIGEVPASTSLTSPLSP
jgi:predicted component of viral defense system (DUF524 family)